MRPLGKAEEHRPYDNGGSTADDSGLKRAEDEVTGVGTPFERGLDASAVLNERARLELLVVAGAPIKR